MTRTALTLLFLGMFLGWLFRYASLRERLGRQVIAMKAESPEFARCAKEVEATNASLQAADAHTDLDLLTHLDEGMITETKRLLIHKLGLFYYRWNSKPEGSTIPTEIKKSLSRIRDSAVEFESVRGVLTYKPGNEQSTA